MSVEREKIGQTWAPLAKTEPLGPAEKLRAEARQARACAQENVDRAIVLAWMGYADGIINALRTLGHLGQHEDP